MPRLLRTCLPLAIAAALCLPSPAAEAQHRRQAPAKPAPQAKHGPTPPPIACAPTRLVGLDAGQARSINFWLKGQAQPGLVLHVEFSCKVDRTRIVVGLSHAPADKEKDEPTKHTVYVLDLSLDPPPARLLRSNAITEPVVIVRPGGGMSLVFGEAVTEKGIALRAFRAVDLASASMQTLFALPVGGSCGPGGPERILISAEAALVDVGDNGPYGLAIGHEDNDCKTGKPDKRTDTFVAVPDGFEELK
ncbi:MAG: hypothetical protein JO055_04955 [Alphaproteobacteria bacterium]|nr:hypothetical protein [Alphaproteobacteria bacterium]